MIYVYNALTFVIPWAGCMVLDYCFHLAKIHPGPWRWKKALVSFGIGTLVVLALGRMLDPHFMDLTR